MEHKPVAKVWGFGAYLQSSFIYYGEMRGSFYLLPTIPSKERLTAIYSRMREFKADFDVVYSELSLKDKTHPLAEERKRWEGLSSDIGKFLDGFEKFKGSYSPSNLSEERKIQLDTYLDIWWMFIQEWNLLSNSVKTKMNSFLKT
jgi:hypothetical protein